MTQINYRLQRKGRGTVTNATGRFEKHAYEAFDDGWGSLDEDLPPLKTEISVDTTKTIIARNQSPDVPFDRSINPYRGCEHGCVYCFARPTHAFLGLSPVLAHHSPRRIRSVPTGDVPSRRSWKHEPCRGR